jgi:hypothetical protein
MGRQGKEQKDQKWPHILKELWYTVNMAFQIGREKMGSPQDGRFRLALHSCVSMYLI